MGGSSAGVAAVAGRFEEIGDEGLYGKRHGKFITIKGPCGEGHTMSLRAAEQLCNWLAYEGVKQSREESAFARWLYLGDSHKPSRSSGRDDAAAISDAAMCGG